MERKNWALVTGAVRSELYLRIIMIKLCDMRAKGKLEGIVLSTWEGEIDGFSGLKEDLKKCGIIVIETPYIDEKIERRFNQLAYTRQNITIEKGLAVIPNHCFVLRLRTDYLNGINEFLRYIYCDEFRTDVGHYGGFKPIYNHRIVLTNYNARHILFANDRFFYGSKHDLKKINTPIIHNRYSKFKRMVENELLCSYAFECVPILRSIWDIVSINFFEKLSEWCLTVTDKDLKLPKIIYRVFAAVCVYAYTHISFSTDLWYRAKNDLPDKIPLVSLFQQKLHSGYEIEKVVMGKLEPTQAAEDFKEELKKIALDLPDANVYTYEEYCELREFVYNRLKAPGVIGEYPFYDKRLQTENVVTGEYVADVLLSDYKNPDFIQEIMQHIEKFDSVYSLLSEKRKQFDDKSTLGIELMKAAVYDARGGGWAA